MSVNNAYVCNNGASLITYTLPAVAGLGQQVIVSGLSAGGWQINQNASQLIKVGNTNSTTGTGGSIASTDASDNVTLTCIVTDITWETSSGVTSGYTIA
jgi:hypothetical protein